MKIIIIPNSIEMINIKCDGYIIGIDGLSTNLPCYFSMEECIDIINSNKEVFVSLNKNMHNNDLEHLKKVLIELSKYKVKIMYYDISIVNINKELNLNLELVWAQEHMTTNALACEYWYKHGAKYVYLSSEITKEEIKTIRDNYKGKIMVNMFGYIPIFTSKRHLVKNYLKYFNIKCNDNLYSMNKEGKNYLIVDDKTGTNVYSNYILNGLIDIEYINPDYIVLNSFNINEKDFKQVVDIYTNLDNIKESNNKINSMFNTSTGFLDIETVYKVKKNEK